MTELKDPEEHGDGAYGAAAALWSIEKRISRERLSQVQEFTKSLAIRSPSLALGQAPVDNIQTLRD
jgi:hypothetical protein